jgi:hypothetical protein
MEMAITHKVTIQGHSFNPRELTITQGDTVEWFNSSLFEEHTITPRNAEFEAKNPLSPQETWPITFNTGGVIEYFCEFHDMDGVITVEAGAAFTKEQAIEYWFAFDNAFLFQPAADIIQAYQQMGGPDAFRRLFITTRAEGTYPAAFDQQAQAVAGGLLHLADAQLAIMDEHFPNEPDSIRLAFEAFGQGILFDDRRRVGDKVHKMDIGGAANPPIGYHRWHPFIRAAVAAGADPERWLHIDRCVGLAWQIQSVAKPEEDNPSNPGLPEEELAGLRERWMSRSADQLDVEFDSTPFPRSEPLVASATGGNTQPG